MTSLRTTGGAVRATAGRPRHVRRPLGSGNLTASTPVVVLDNTRHNAFGGGYRRVNGTLVSVWREGPQHDVALGADRGTIQQSVSTDNGQTWGTPTVLYTDTATEWDARDPTVANLGGGLLLLTFFLHSGVTDANGVRSYCLRSTDDGLTWSARIPLNTGFTLDAVCNPPVRYPDGTLACAVYGRFTLGGGGKHSVVIVHSADDGQTWGNPVTVIDAEAEGQLRDYLEPGLDVDPWTGDVLCVMRTSDGIFYTARSADNGRTWSASTSIGFATGGRPSLGRITRGGLVLMYRAAGAMRMTTTWDHGVTWEPTVVFDDADSQKSAYAQLVEVATDTLAVFYFMQQLEELADARFAWLTYPPATPP